jgi:aminopeptidase N
MGFNETRYMWMDEGFTNFNEHKFTGDGISLQAADMASYPQLAGKLADYPLMFYKAEEASGFFSFMTYVKHCNNLLFLESLLGKESFLKATREFMKNWNGKHPTPYDMFYSYSRFASGDINWFWKACYFEPGYADLAIKSVEKKIIVIEKKGNMPVPVYIEVTYDDGSKEKAFASLDIWKDGLSEYQVKLKSSKNIKSVKLGNLMTPDANPSDNAFKQ